MVSVGQQRCRAILKDNLLVILMIIAVVIGTGMGLGLRNEISTKDKKAIFYLQFPGDLLLNMLKMLILPLIVSSLVSSMSGLKAQATGRMGLRTVVYYMLTTFGAVILGIILVSTIRPGHKRDTDIERSGTPKSAEGVSALLDLIRNCFPSNLIQACFQKQETVTEYEKINVKQYTIGLNATYNSSTDSDTNNSSLINQTIHTQKTINGDVISMKVHYAEGMNVLGLVVFSLFLGGVLTNLGEKGKPLVDVFDCLHLATMKLITLVIWYSPFGIIFLIAAKLVGMEKPMEMFTQLGYYMLTVLVGLAIHAFIVLPLIYFLFTRKNPYKFLYGMLQPMLTAWGTASSSATLPVTMDCLQKRNHVDPRVTMFVTPIGATINMDGTALYEAVAAIFIAQYLGVSLDIGRIIIISLTATAAAIGAAGVPSAGLVTMAIVLSAVGLPVEEVRLVLALDWFLDRFRTAVNVLGDSFGAGIVDHLSRQDLDEMDKKSLKDESQKGDHANGVINNLQTPDKNINTKI
ncbi:excitatory amino acid transporter 3-like [Saccostrea cucullata]|uniref:excitatory amino acid transporter 3-like n=1 Tax=Saccostrea cuccullata TaxID=36930 RepID=UPI002ED58377